MTTPKKPPPYRQTSFTYDPPSARQKRKSFSKQFSEDITELKASLLEQNAEIRVCLGGKQKRNATDRPPPAKVAWSHDAKEEAVIVKKCKEVRKAKLTRHASLEKESILNSKQDLTERLRTRKEEPEKENKADSKPNLEIFLAGPNPKKADNDDTPPEKNPPKYLQPLVADGLSNKNFQIKKSGSKKVSESPRRPKSSTVVVVPLIDKDQEAQTNTKAEKSDDASGINVIIRPVTAQSRRERFQKRTNSAFHGAVKEQQTASRPPLVRSSSAPSTRPEKSKFLATKRKMKSAKKFKDESGSRSNTETKEWQNAIQHPTDIVTMVSLVSPGGSDNEEEAEEEIEQAPTQRERPKSVLKQESITVEKPSNKDTNKNISLRKTIKSVSFQQSSIHAIRSFSASFPSRRSSMATALALNTSQDNDTSSRHAPTKNQEKRGTNPSSPNSEERQPKRRLLRNKNDENNQR
ncbi:hypothetical protein GWI33_006776 [Rhynchophorus ferrugineus]|uniref:Uncharacterized protein n=1 Tax=Rhynchophorus ferrugineus TaxID=354439 RepID=A0A834IKK8_RHYFE|nr:hypothetical protein GWI33_006776 [Rhynchophorus ferrugineus]